MTYIDYLNRFNRWLESNTLPSNAVELYVRMLHAFNCARWPGSMRIDTARLMVLSHSQKNAAYRARDKLAEAGFIHFRKGSKGKPTLYFLSEKETVNGTASRTESETISGAQEIRYKTKKKKDPPSPQGGSLNPWGAELDGFDAFWQAYPRKVSKQAARKAWERLSPDEALLSAILAAVERDKQSDQWQRDGGQFIPYPATWLNGRRWEDEPDEPEPPPSVNEGPWVMLPDTERRDIRPGMTAEEILALLP